jgi:hypothetical protein
MHIEVIGDDSISPQARTYAEYRVFAALTQPAGGERVRMARVHLRGSSRNGTCDAVTCTVTVALNGSNQVRLRTVGSHAYAAINGAVERLRAARAADAGEPAVEAARAAGG